MSERTKSENQRYEDEKKVAADLRSNQIIIADYSAAQNFDELYGDLSTAEIKRLYTENASFKATVDKLNLPPEQTQTLARSQDEIDAEKAAEAAAAAIPVAQTPEEIQAEQDRLTAEAAAANVIPTVPNGSVEELYDGIEKIGEGSYKLTVTPGDGSPDEIFYGVSQKECFKALRRSKANATKELRRRRKKIEISNDLKALEVEVINYAPLMKPVILTPDEIFTLTEQLKDPITVLEATRKLRQASITPEECTRQNEATERQRYSDQFNTAVTWMQQHPEFYNCPENIQTLQEFMGTLNWAVTIKNLNLAFSNLQEQGVLLEPPEDESTVQPTPQPASVVPVVVAPVVAAPVAVVAPPKQVAATAGALPDATKVLRPGSSSTGIQPTQRIETIRVAAPAVLSAEEYNAMPAATVKMKYQRDPKFKDQVDALIASGKI